MNASRQFRYRLESLLRKRESESEQLRQEQAAARRRVESCEHDLKTVEAAIAQTQTRLRDLSRVGAAIDPDMQARLRTYLKVLELDRGIKQEKLANARREHEDIGTRLRAMREAIKTLEKHREGRRADFDAHWRRREQAVADELWLLRRPADRSEKLT